MTSNYSLGAIVPITFYIRDATSALVNATTVTLTITLPDGSTTSPTVTNPPSVTGTYTYNYTTVQAGNHEWVATSTVPTTSTPPERFRVRDTLADYATLTDLKSYLTITSTDTVDDNELYIALDAAQAAVERMTGRCFGYASATSARLFSKVSSSGYIQIDDVATATGLTVGTSNGDGTYTTLASTSWTVKPDNAIVRGYPITGIQTYGACTTSALWPAFQVTAKWGWPQLPAEITQATLILAGRLFKRKGSPEGVAGFGEFGTVRITGSDPDVARLLAPYTIPGVA